MLLVAITVFPFLCALILFTYFFGKFAGKSDTPEIAGAMHQMNQARIIPFREPQPDNARARAAGA
ncbi:MAG: hypothetical protein DMG64_11560 [Acidobacteria bacterium]|nr:MAG: hypothetical protein DMG63_06770 [Acidobacteriota bacterium]PYY02459.1 MAG: hypothetical protein DMG64_11560 [Acidobacteriota bacterium]PYY23730.1 MAG: hypothetical protein DMG62_07040 [Acidobacteriota bacterium]